MSLNLKYKCAQNTLKLNNNINNYYSVKTRNIETPKYIVQQFIVSLSCHPCFPTLKNTWVCWQELTMCCGVVILTICQSLFKCTPKVAHKEHDNSHWTYHIENLQFYQFTLPLVECVSYVNYVEQYMYNCLPKYSFGQYIFKLWLTQRSHNFVNRIYRPTKCSIK